MAVTVLAAYDIVEDGPRARVAATLQRWGTRVQYSVFVCTLEEADVETMLRAVESIMNPEKDSFLVLRQCASCWDARIVRGQSEPTPPTLYWAVF